MSLETVMTLQVVANYVSALDLVTSTSPLNYRKRVELATGTAAGKADKIWSDTRTIAASGTDDLDLAAGLTDAFGASITFVKVKAIIISAAAGNTNNVLVGGDATNTFLTWVESESDAVVLRPGATFALIAGEADATGYAVTASTGDLLRIRNSAGSTGVDYSIIIIGTSA